MSERTYRIHVAAERSGVRVELIRAWERRYGVVTPRRTPSGYRVYTDRDVMLLSRLKQLTEQGVAISEAAAMLPQLLAEIDAGHPLSPSKPDALKPDALKPDAERPRDWREESLAAAKAMDSRWLARSLDEALAGLPPLRAYEEVLVPLQREVGDRWHAGQLSVGQEHLVTQEVRARLIGLLHSAPHEGSWHVLLACFPEEQHELGLLGAALWLRHAGMRVTVLGSRTPTADVVRMACDVKVDCVGLSAVMDPGERAFENTLRVVREGLPAGMPVWVGGPAARLHSEVCKRLGVSTIERAADLPRLLRG